MFVANQSVIASTESSPSYLVRENHSSPHFQKKTLKYSNYFSTKNSSLDVTHLERQLELLHPGRKAKSAGTPVNSQHKKKISRRM